MNKQNVQWASELIGDDYKQWGNEIIFLGLGTGRGKTTFILEHYADFISENRANNEKILYLCNRIKLAESVRERIFNAHLENVIEVMTYQKYQSKVRKCDEMKVYKSYICDEAHYFLSDADFNDYTDLSYYSLLEKSNDSTVVFMTATYKDIFALIESDYKIKYKRKVLDEHKYFLPTDYSYVNSIFWYKSKKDTYAILDNILENTDEKVIYFANSVALQEDLYYHYLENDIPEVYNNSNIRFMEFICSKNSSKDFANTIRKKYPDVLQKGEKGDYTFKNRVLITTKLLDNGVDFKDRNIKHIICDIRDIDSAIQCLGRKRKQDESDTVTFYIRDYRSNEWHQTKNNTKRKLEPAMTFVKEGKDAWVKKYGHNRNNQNAIIYPNYLTGKPAINWLSYQKGIQTLNFAENCINKTTTYKDEILEVLGDTVQGRNKTLMGIEEKERIDSIKIFANSHLNQQMAIRGNLHKRFLEIINVKRNGKKLTSISVINSTLETLKQPYRVISKRIRIKGKKTTMWILVSEENFETENSLLP